MSVLKYRDSETGDWVEMPALRGTDGYTPVKGVDYYTEDDKAEIVAMVIESLGGNPIFGIVDVNNHIILNGNLADGTYTIKYEMENGSTIDIGDLVLDNNVYYSVTNNLTNCVSSNTTTEAIDGESYSATITANSGYELSSVVVTMGGNAVSVTDGTINIASVTGNIVITAVATEVQTEVEPVTVDIALTDGIRIGSDGGDRTVNGMCATEMIDLRSIPKPCTINLTKAKWCSDGSTTTVRYYVANASGTALANGATVPGATDYFTVVDNSTDDNGDVTVTVTSEDVGYIRFSGSWANAYSDSTNTFAAANTKATLTYTPVA